VISLVTFMGDRPDAVLGDVLPTLKDLRDKSIVPPEAYEAKFCTLRLKGIVNMLVAAQDDQFEEPADEVVVVFGPFSEQEDDDSDDDEVGEQLAPSATRPQQEFDFFAPTIGHYRVFTVSEWHASVFLEASYFS
jgi:hypothetical protein